MLELHSEVGCYVRTAQVGHHVITALCVPCSEIAQWGAMLELHSVVGTMLELHSAVGRHVKTAQWGVMLELHCGHYDRITQWGAMLELHSVAPY